ncbi:MAG: hypothetical protein ABI347_08315 [Nitrososphaera sp.]|jgi:hypothetical protein
MVKAIMATTIAALALLFFTAAAQQQSYAQYGTGPTTGKVTEETLAKCKEFGIGKAQCSESAVLLAERLQLQDKGGSGTAMLALGSDQTIAFIGILGAVFGGVSAAFFIRGRQRTTPA